MTISYEVLKTIIDEWDPVELLCTHAPPDEYEVEVSEINKLLISEEQGASIEKVASIVYEIFVRAFGDDVFLKNKEDCNEVAIKIMNSIK